MKTTFWKILLIVKSKAKRHKFPQLPINQEYCQISSDRDQQPQAQLWLGELIMIRQTKIKIRMKRKSQVSTI